MQGIVKYDLKVNLYKECVMEDIVEKIKKCGDEGTGFADLLAWASEQRIKSADFVIQPAIKANRVRIDFTLGKYFAV